MTKITITNLRYVEPTNTLIDMDVVLDDGRTVPFTYSPTDQEPASLEVKAILESGDHPPIAAYVPRQKQGERK